MTIILLAGIVFTIILLTKQREFASVSFVTNISGKFQRSTLSNNYWIAGGFLFSANAALFALAFVILFFLPYGSTFGLLLCIPLSLITWLVFNEMWNGSFKDKVKMVCIGNSFFLFFIGWMTWYYLNLEPAYPGDDMFMAWIGFIFGIIFTTGAMGVSMFVILRKNR
ncbi:hypothetical protein AWM68_08965 [Fictibacillus phosphorivorans]|uniref:Uncharacterized protein n=1 Tax=Fictibacillus phosphorivorans TaxID=1221500 RepID=A0A165N691_9BACL|nr:hypothetical protein [Fictibacillus phosphorivorans]KZE64784.1 hypothetical protein AWM68_08965 [Fictibacillus phosphorivorans]